MTNLFHKQYFWKRKTYLCVRKFRSLTHEENYLSLIKLVKLNVQVWKHSLREIINSRDSEKDLEIFIIFSRNIFIFQRQPAAIGYLVSNSIYRPGREYNVTRAAIARHKTCFILWRAIVVRPKDLWHAIKKF